MKSQPLTHAERGRLGGLKAAEAMTPQERTIRAQKAGLSMSGNGRFMSSPPSQLSPVPVKITTRFSRSSATASTVAAALPGNGYDARFL